MKILTSTAIVAAAFIAFTIPQIANAADGGQVKNDLFTIALPAGFSEFATQTQTTPGADGKKIETTNWVSKAPTGEAVIVTVSKMPGKILDPEKLFASTRDSLLKTVKATLESDEKREGDVPSARLLFHSDGAFFRSRFVANDNRFYQLLYVGRSADQRSAPAVAQLFESFQINAAPTPVQAAGVAPTAKPN
jgi:hypothetical protein